MRIYMGQTDGKPTLIIETGNGNSDKYIMIGEFPLLLDKPGTAIFHGNGEGGMDPEPADAKRLLELLADDLGYTLTAK